MLAFKVAINGVHICTAAPAQDDFLMAQVNWYSSLDDRNSEEVRQASFSVFAGGPSDSQSGATWVQTHLSLGDCVALTLVDGEVADAPQHLRDWHRGATGAASTHGGDLKRTRPCQCLRLSLNGAPVCTAGVKAGVVSASVFWDSEEAECQAQDHATAVPWNPNLSVRGCLPTNSSSTQRHVKWIDQQVSIEDEILIELVESADADRAVPVDMQSLEQLLNGDI